MKRFATVFLGLLLLCGTAVHAQTLSFFDPDTSAFPIMKAKLFAFDATGQQIRPSVPELDLTENGIRRTILSVTCPPPAPPKSLSSVLVIDVSGSMQYGVAGTPNVDLAKAAARAWVNALPLTTSECAVTSFDNDNYLNQDFTTDAAKLHTAINGLGWMGGTNYDKGLLLPFGGGLYVSRNGQYQKVIIFLTDGQPNFPPSTAAIIDEAKKQNCIIYAVTLGMSCPSMLKQISLETGGNWFENVTTVKQAEDVYTEILRQAQSSGPCEITWQSTGCPAGGRIAELTWSGVSSKAVFLVPQRAAVQLSFSPIAMFIRSKPVGVPFDTTVTVTATNSAFNVVNVTSSNPAYDINPKSFNLAAGASQTLTIRYTPPDSGYTWTEFDFQTDICPQRYAATAGFPGKAPKTPQLKLDHPNGGEVLVVASDTVITWSGIPKSDVVKLEYSTNSGSNWLPIASKVSGGRYAWRVPNTPSTDCLARVTRLKTGGADDRGVVHTLLGHAAVVYSAKWSPDGRYVVTASGDRTARVWNAETGAVVSILSGHSSDVVHAAWSPDGLRVATASLDGTAKIWDAATGAEIHTLIGHQSALLHLSWSPDGSRIATASADSTGRIWNAQTGALTRTLRGHRFYVWQINWSPDGGRVATASLDATAMIWDANSGSLIHNLDRHTQQVNSVEWNADGTRVVTSSHDYTARIWNTADGGLVHTLTHPIGTLHASWNPQGTHVATGSFDRNARIWNAQTGALVHTMTEHSGDVIYVRWSPDGMRLASTSYDNNAKVWDASTGALVFNLVGHGTQINTAEWSSDGRFLSTASDDGTAKIWSMDEVPTLVDVSDALFSIVRPQPDAIDIDMGQVLVGTLKDSTVQVFVQNRDSYPFRVDSIVIAGTGASQFGIVSGGAPFVVPGNGSHAVEFHFSPTSVGAKTAQMRIFTQTDVLRKTIRGEGIEPALEVIGDLVDFGKVMVGKQKDRRNEVTIKNVGTAPLTITATAHAGPNDKDFTTLAGGGSFTIQPGDTARMDLRFIPAAVGRTSGRLLFEYNGPGSPATVQLYGEGVATDIVVLERTIDFGKVEVGRDKDTIQTVTITNIGETPALITGTRHGGPNSVDFTTLGGGGAFTLQPGDTARLDLRFSPKTVGATSGTLLFDYSGPRSPATVNLLGEGIAPSIIIINDTIDFGRVELGKEKDTIQAVTVANIGEAAVTITGTPHGGPNSVDFITLAGGAPIVLQPGDSARMDIRFRPSAIGATSGSILFEYGSPAGPATVRLLGEGFTPANPAKATVLVSSASARAGDMVDIPIVLTESANVASSGATGFTARLRYNATLLEPTGATPVGALQGDERIIELTLPAQGDANGVLTTLQFRAALGTDSVTALLLEDANAVGGVVAMTVVAGQFRLEDLCQAGGARLINPNGVITLKHIHPNPTTGQSANVELETTEIGRTILSLSDMRGRAIKTLIDGEIAPGRRILQLDLHDVPVGSYFLTLRTPTEQRTIRVEVAR